jgi:exocyst complex component 4
LAAVISVRFLMTLAQLLREILVEELHGHLYVKSFWCESRWATYTPGQQTSKSALVHQKHRISLTSIPVRRVEYEDADLTPDMALRPESSKRARLSRYLDELATRNNDPPYDINDTTSLRASVAIKASASSSLLATSSLAANGTREGSNPEADSFAYMEMLLEALAVLGRLGNALDITAQRVPSEIYALTDAVLEEVAERAAFVRRGSLLGAGELMRFDALVALSASLSATSAQMSPEVLLVPASPDKDGYLPASALRSVALESSAKQADHEVLRDLFWTLYSKLLAVVQGLRVISEVSNRIGSVGSSARSWSEI